MSNRKTDEINPALVPGYILGGILLLFCVYVSYRLQETQPERYFNMGLVAVGGVLGWVVGILLSPRGQQQQQQFQTLSRALGTFISGFLLAKLAPVFDKAAIDSQNWNLTNGLRTILFTVAFFLGLLFVFVGRSQTAPISSQTPV